MSKNHPSSLTSPISAVERVAADRFEPALRVGELGPQHGAQDAVVAARDELALRPAHDARAVREAGADGEVAVAGDQRRDQRQQPAQVGREVDVHVGHDLRRARRPGGAQRAAAALLLEPQVAHARQRHREPPRDLGRGVDRRVVGDHDPPGEREAVRQEAVQPADALLQAGGLVVDGNDDLDVERRRGRERAPGSGSQEGRGELGHGFSFGSGRKSALGRAEKLLGPSSQRSAEPKGTVPLGSRSAPQAHGRAAQLKGQSLYPASQARAARIRLPASGRRWVPATWSISASAFSGVSAAR